MKRSSPLNSTLAHLKARRKRRISAEQITLAIATLVVLTLVGLILLSWITQSNQPPVLMVEQQALREAEGHYYVPFKITNQGGETASSVQVVGELKIKGDVAESGEQQIDFLSGGESEEGAFIFVQDPREGEFTIRVASYSLP
jgi:uncharacterized protein (TIGR02588 family)